MLIETATYNTVCYIKSNGVFKHLLMPNVETLENKIGIIYNYTIERNGVAPEPSNLIEDMLLNGERTCNTEFLMVYDEYISLTGFNIHECPIGQLASVKVTISEVVGKHDVNTKSVSAKIVIELEDICKCSATRYLREDKAEVTEGSLGYKARN